MNRVLGRLRAGQGWRRAAAVVVGAAVILTGLTIPSAPAQADLAVPTFDWGSPPAGGLVLATANLHGSGGEPAGGGLFYQPRDCRAADCLRRLTSDVSDSGPEWSPTGREIAFTRRFQDPETFNDVTRLMVLSTDTGAVRVLTPLRMDVPGTDPVEWQHFPVEWPSWSPTGGSIVVDSPRGPAQVPAEGGDPVFFDQVANTAPRDCPDIPGNTYRHFRSRVAWSPDGTMWAYLRQDRLVGEFSCLGDAVRVFVSSAGVAATEHEVPLGSAKPHAVGVDWSPDGSRLAVTLDGVRGDLHRTITLTPTGGDVVLIRSVGGTAPPGYSPDGTFLVTDRVAHSLDGTEPPFGCAFTTECVPQMGDGDPQCAPATCLSAVQLSVVGGPDSATGFAGDIAGTARPGAPLFVRVPGDRSYTTTASPPAGQVLTDLTCEDTDSTGVVSTGIITARVAVGEVVRCTVGLNNAGDSDGDGLADNVDPCPADPQNRCIDTDGDGTPDHLDPCPADPSNQCGDSDGDGIADAVDPCPQDATNTCNDPDPVCDVKVSRAEYRVVAFGQDAFGFAATVRWCTDGQDARLLASAPVISVAEVEPGGVTVLFDVMDRVIGIHFELGDPQGFDLGRPGDGRLIVTVPGEIEACFNPAAILAGLGLTKAIQKVVLSKKYSKLTPAEQEQQLFKTIGEKIENLLPRVLKPYTTAVAQLLEESTHHIAQQIVQNGYAAATDGLLTACIPGWGPEIQFDLLKTGHAIANYTGTDAFPSSQVQLHDSVTTG